MARFGLLSSLITFSLFLPGGVGAPQRVSAQKLTGMTDRLNITHIDKDFPVTDLDNKMWERAEIVDVTTYWSGESAPDGRRFAARLLWSEKALYVRLEAPQDEPFIVSDKPDVTKKTLGLWDRDVCEIFIAPNPAVPNKDFANIAVRSEQHT